MNRRNFVKSLIAGVAVVFAPRVVSEPTYSELVEMMGVIEQEAATIDELDIERIVREDLACSMAQGWDQVTDIFIDEEPATAEDLARLLRSES